MKVVITKVHESLFNGEADAVTVPTGAGLVTILPKHEPYVATIKPGTIVVKTQSGEQTFTVSDGVLEVSGDQATVIL